ncbi:unnamed protein product [Boreogadus saida]
MALEPSARRDARGEREAVELRPSGGFHAACFRAAYSFVLAMRVTSTPAKKKSWKSYSGGRACVLLSWGPVGPSRLERLDVRHRPPGSLPEGRERPGRVGSRSESSPDSSVTGGDQSPSRSESLETNTESDLIWN